jgi:hypothetical protein
MRTTHQIPADFGPAGVHALAAPSDALAQSGLAVLVDGLRRQECSYASADHGPASEEGGELRVDGSVGRGLCSCEQFVPSHSRAERRTQRNGHGLADAHRRHLSWVLGVQDGAVVARLGPLLLDGFWRAVRCHLRHPSGRIRSLYHHVHAERELQGSERRPDHHGQGRSVHGKDMQGLFGEVGYAHADIPWSYRLACPCGDRTSRSRGASCLAFGQGPLRSK